MIKPIATTSSADTSSVVPIATAWRLRNDRVSFLSNRSLSALISADAPRDAPHRASTRLPSANPAPAASAIRFD